MADITVTAAQVAAIKPEEAKIVPMKANVDLTAGQLVAIVIASGDVNLADADAAQTAQVRGIALETVKAGQIVDVLVEGLVAGYAVSAIAYDHQLWLSSTAGAMADAAPAGPAITVPCARVVPMTDMSLTKVVYFKADWRIQFS